MALALPHYHSFVCVRILSKLSKGGLTVNKPTRLQIPSGSDQPPRHQPGVGRAWGK